MDNRNFVAAVLLSIAILAGFHYFYEAPRVAAVRQEQLAQRLEQQPKPQAAPQVPEVIKDRAAVIAEAPRVRIETPELHGSINLKGARIDDLTLVNYHETTDPNSPEIVLLSPTGSAAPHTAYYTEMGWLGTDTPTPQTVWKADSNVLTPTQPVKLSWDNGKGLVFERTIMLDDKFMFTVTDRVRNSGGEVATLYPYGLISRHGKPKTEDIFIMHEGPIGVLGGTLQEHKYANLMDDKKKVVESEDGWLGFTDKYWLVTLIPGHGEKITASFTYDRAGEDKSENGVFQSDFRGTPVSLAAGASAERTLRVFAGAKRLNVLDHYAEQYNIPRFYDAIDFGWFWFLTKPFLYLLDFLGSLLGNFGLAILAFTVLLKLVTLPLSMKSYRSMARMRALQPQLQEIQERFKDDRAKVGLETMELYKREKVSPLSGCVPNLIQIPIFFALYKVLYVGIEMRHAPFYGWIHDLSAPDPTSVLTLFGLLDWSFIPHLGVWPILMGISMYLTQRLSPQPPDKTQAQIFLFLPIIFTFMLGNMAAGLIIYWTWSNVLGLAQQWFIMGRVRKG